MTSIFLTTSEWNDPDYDGVVIKIPKGVLLTNPELQDSLDALGNTLKNCKFSTSHPSFTKNLNEIFKRDSKLQLIKEVEEARKREREAKLQKRKHLFSLIRKKKLYLVEWRKVTYPIGESISINGEWFGYNARLGVDTALTKRGVRKEVQTKFQQHVGEDPEKLAEYLGSSLRFYKVRNVRLYQDAYTNIACSFEALHVIAWRDLELKSYYLVTLEQRNGKLTANHQGIYKDVSPDFFDVTPHLEYHEVM